MQIRDKVADTCLVDGRTYYLAACHMKLAEVENSKRVLMRAGYKVTERDHKVEMGDGRKVVAHCVYSSPLATRRDVAGLLERDRRYRR